MPFDTDIEDKEHGYIAKKNGEIFSLEQSYGQGVRIKVYGLENKQFGGIDKKSLASCTFLDSEGNETSKRIPMFLKKGWVSPYDTFGQESSDMSDSLRYVERWRFLRDIGIPVAPNIVALEKDTIAMLNMADGGGEFFGKQKNFSLTDESNKEEQRDLTVVERIFLKIDRKEIEKEIERIQVIMDEHGIDFPWDDRIEIFVWPDGKWKVFVWDLSRLVRLYANKQIDRASQRGEILEIFDQTRESLKKVGGKLINHE